MESTHFLATRARRGRRYPAGAHAAAVCASLRLHCDARSGVASQNSLRSLCSLRSNSRDESVDEARAARAPTPALCFSSPQKSPLPGTTCREDHRWWRACFEHRGASAKASAGSRRSASARPRSAGLVARARSAHQQLTRRSCLSAVSEANEASSATGPRDRAPQGTIAKRGPAAKRSRLPALSFARAKARTHGGLSKTATGRDQPIVSSARAEPPVSFQTLRS